MAKDIPQDGRSGNLWMENQQGTDGTTGLPALSYSPPGKRISAPHRENPLTSLRENLRIRI
jgi:hypothetical protein